MPAKKSSAKKTSAPKNATKKTAAKKASPAAAKKAVKKAAAKKAAPEKASKKAASTKSPASAPREKATAKEDTEAQKLVLGARKRKATPSHFKPTKKGNTPIVFTMEDVAEILNKRGGDTPKPAPTQAAPAAKKATKAAEVAPPPEEHHRNHAAASLADILGFDPTAPAAQQPARNRKGEVPKKWQKYYDALTEMRDHLRQGLELHSHDTLRRSSKDDSGDLSGYGQHMADAGTDAFDRDFALSLVSSEQDALNEIEDALDRIFDGTYGQCEITGEQISEERLEAVPFTRYSVVGQRQLESSRRLQKQRGGAFSDVEDENLVLSDEEE
ncbi:MAG: TraR/DksA family transcriptional regulator [Opitutales bacterium]